MTSLVMVIVVPAGALTNAVTSRAYSPPAGMAGRAMSLDASEKAGATVQRFTWDGEGDGEGDGEQVSCVSESPVGTLCTSCAPSGTSSDPTFRTRIR